jgi:hypothetical protein
VRIWSDSTVSRWHGVWFSEYAVWGIPSKQPLTCDWNCYVFIPRTKVDSMKVGYHTVAEYLVFGVVTLSLLYFDAKTDH